MAVYALLSENKIKNRYEKVIFGDSSSSSSLFPHLPSRFAHKNVEAEKKPMLTTRAKYM